MVANMEVDKVADMEMANMEMADIEVDMVALPNICCIYRTHVTLGGQPMGQGG